MGNTGAASGDVERIATFAVGGAIFSMLAFYLINRKMRRINENSSSSRDDGSYDFDVTEEAIGNARFQGFERNNENSNVLLNSNTGNNAATVPFFPVKNELLDSSDSDDSHSTLMRQMNSAMASGDWAAVAALAGDLSVAEDENSTISSQYSISGVDRRCDSNNVRQEDAKRSAKIDELIGIEEWKAGDTTCDVIHTEENADDLESSRTSSNFNSSPNLVDNSSGMNKLNISGVGFASGSVEKEAQKAYSIGIGMEIYKNYSSDNSKNVSESDNSEESRNELDRAMETGDWTEVDKQASQILGTFRESGPKESIENKSVSLSYDNDSDSQNDWSTEDEGAAPSLDGSSIIDNERINMLESLIDSDDWQGIVTVARIHHQTEDSTIASSIHEIDADQTMREEHDTDLDSLR